MAYVCTCLNRLITLWTGNRGAAGVGASTSSTDSCLTTPSTCSEDN